MIAFIMRNHRKEQPTSDKYYTLFFATVETFLPFTILSLLTHILNVLCCPLPAAPLLNIKLKINTIMARQSHIAAAHKGQDRGDMQMA